MRRITHIVIHHSASPLSTTAADIEKWHRARGWAMAGYHLICEADGRWILGRPIGRAGAHCKGYNKNSLGICLIGNNTVSGDEWRWIQIDALKAMLASLRILFPGAEVFGHKDVPGTATKCPGLDLQYLLGSA